MKGVVFNLLEQIVAAEYGDAAWDSLLEASGVDGAYTAIGSYPDEELGRLVGAASSTLDKPADDLIRWFGRQALPLLGERYPQFFADHDSTPSFLLTLNEVIHPEVRKLFPGADAPDFSFERREPNVLAMGYNSRRGLCSFAEGLIEGAADRFGESVSIEQSECTKRGSERCVLVCSFASRPS